MASKLVNVNRSNRSFSHAVVSQIAIDVMQTSGRLMETATSPGCSVHRIASSMHPRFFVLGVSRPGRSAV